MTTDLAALTSEQVAHLPPEELTPHLVAAYHKSHGHDMAVDDLAAALDMVAQGHWVPGLPARHPHPEGPEAGLAELFGEPEPVECHHGQEPGTCTPCYAELKERRK